MCIRDRHLRIHLIIYYWCGWIIANKESFHAILATLQQQNEAIQQLLKPKPSPVTTTNYKFDKSDLKVEEFSTYLERFQNYLDICGIADIQPSVEDFTDEEREGSEQISHVKKTILLGCLNRYEFLDIKSELKDKKIANITYDELLQILQKRYDKEFNV